MTPSTSPLARRLARGLTGAGRDPVAHRIVEHVWTEVVDGTLDAGARMPTSREIAIELGVSPRTVDWAYDQLERLGVVATRAGEGTFVSLAPPPEEQRRRRTAFLELCGEAVERAAELGYDVDELIGALAEYRSVERAGVESAGGRGDR